MTPLEPHFSYLRDELTAARAAPLSAKRALLVALLIDAYVDRLFAISGEDDLLAFRARLAVENDGLGLVMGVAARTLPLVTEAVEVPLADYHRLSEADFMVSLYNQHSVQRVRIVLAEGGRRDMLPVLVEAVEQLRRM